MKRSGEPMRQVPLVRTSGLARTGGLERGGRLNRAVPLRAGKRNGPSKAVRLAVLKRDGYCCVCCGQSVIGKRYSLAHRVRASQGGKAVTENLIVLLGLGAEQHHGRVDLYKDPQDEVKGYRLPSMTDGEPTNPADFPVAYETPDGLAWFWLLPDGKRKPAGAREVAA